MRESPERLNYILTKSCKSLASIEKQLFDIEPCSENG